jgi:AcrR family transcriptional regulator
MRRAANRTAQKSPPASAAQTGAQAAPAGARARRAAERRDAILAAALDEFSAQGFAATRLDDVAKRAGVAKGTIYLYFADKETLFQELIRAELSPVVGGLIQVSHADIPIRQFVHHLVDVFAREVFETRRKDVIRLVLTEGSRFPKLAEFYYQEIIARVLPAVRALLRRAVERGELKHDALVKYPQLLPAPMLLAIMWHGLFDRFEPLDVRALMRAHFDILFSDRRAP